MGIGLAFEETTPRFFLRRDRIATATARGRLSDAFEQLTNHGKQAAQHSVADLRVLGRTRRSCYIRILIPAIPCLLSFPRLCTPVL